MSDDKPRGRHYAPDPEPDPTDSEPTAWVAEPDADATTVIPRYPRDPDAVRRSAAFTHRTGGPAYAPRAGGWVLPPPGNGSTQEPPADEAGPKPYPSNSPPRVWPPEPVAPQSEPATPRPEPVATPSEPVATRPQPVAAPSEPVATPSEPVATPSEPVATPSEPVATPLAPERAGSGRSALPVPHIDPPDAESLRSRLDWWGRRIERPDPPQQQPAPGPVRPHLTQSDGSETIVIPAVPTEPDDPAARAESAQSVRPPTAQGSGPRHAQPKPVTDRPEKGVQVIPLRPIRTEDGYKSVYSQYTRPTIGNMARTFSRGAGEVLITVGLIVLLFAGYEVWGKAAIVDAHQNDLGRTLAQDWGPGGQPSPSVSPSGSPSPVPQPASGTPIGKLYIPRMKKQWVVVQGVAPINIKYAPGHYPDSALPGAVGNFSVAGHRIPSMFWDLDQIRVGDPIVVETSDTWYVYTAVLTHVVTPHSIEVVAPVPNQPGVTPTDAMLTLTTCNPKWNNYQRLVVHAKLARSQAQSVGRPTELGA